MTGGKRSGMSGESSGRQGRGWTAVLQHARLRRFLFSRLLPDSTLFFQDRSAEDSDENDAQSHTERLRQLAVEDFTGIRNALVVCYQHSRNGCNHQGGTSSIGGLDSSITRYEQKRGKRKAKHFEGVVV